MSRSPVSDGPVESGRENGCCRQTNNKTKSIQLLHHKTDSQKPLVARCESEGVEITAVRMPGKREHIVNFVSRSRKGAGEDEVRVSGGGGYRYRSRRCQPSCMKSVLCFAVLILLIITFVLVALLVRSTCDHLFNNTTNTSASVVDVVTPRVGQVVDTEPSAIPLVWENFRLPTNLKPSHYILSIRTDINRGVFAGNITIHFDCLQSTDIILLHTKELNYSLQSFRFVKEDGNAVVSLNGPPTFYEENDFMVLRTVSALQQGERYSLSMQYVASFNENLIGLFLSKYVTSEGITEHVVASFLSPTHARRVYPCFDEPAFKANFTISITHPVGYMALSNMDAIDHQTTTTTSEGEVWETTSFRTTPLMSTYLVAFVVSKFQSKQRLVRGGVEFRVWAQEDAIEQADFALDIGVRLFNILEDFSGFEYPLPKLDMIALPQFVVAGMENWGLVTYREEYMLYDKSETPTESIQKITFVIAHELGHQWYSNLVTQVYWDELWLKECFATVMAKIALEDLFPDWSMWDEQFVVNELQMVMKIDSLVTSHPVQQPVRKAGDILDNFDTISYQKSPAILRMLEHSIRYETFKAGLEVFLHNKQYGNADAWDIWRAITSVTQAHGEYRDISTLMAPWLGQMGYPVVTVSRDCGQDMVCLQQEHFLLDKGKAEESQYKYIWPIPVTFSSAASNDIISPYTYWLNTRSGAFAIPNVQRDQWILLNVNRTGFFRTNYNIHNWRLLIGQLMEDHKIISPASRAALIDDVFSFATEGRLNLSLALDLTRYLERETDYVPWKGAIITFEYIDSMLRTTPVYGIFKEYMLHQASTVYDYVGWNNTGPHKEKLLRVMILQKMCAYGHQGCIGKTKELFQNVSSDYEIPPDYRSFAYSTRVASGGVDAWESTWNAYKQSSPAEAKNYLAALTATGEPWLINRLLSRTLDPEQLPLTDAVVVFQFVSKNPIGGYLAWNFFRDQWDLLKERYASGLFFMNDIIQAVTEWFNTQYQLEELETFISNKKEDLENLAGVSSFLQAIDNTKTNIRWMENKYGQLEEWLENWKTQKS